ncbi:hypothetical protein SUSAZ_04935 [Sulfolobus acidocaldarius SUSAZ]|nr:hypothetical protein SUSAZ_04935 [Sulfolobus acidocaldarius SUSAZ]
MRKFHDIIKDCKYYTFDDDTIYDLTECEILEPFLPIKVLKFYVDRTLNKVDKISIKTDHLEAGLELIEDISFLENADFRNLVTLLNTETIYANLLFRKSKVNSLTLVLRNMMMLKISYPHDIGDSLFYVKVFIDYADKFNTVHINSENDAIIFLNLARDNLPGKVSVLSGSVRDVEKSTCDRYLNFMKFLNLT